MKTIIIKSNGDRKALNNFMQKLENYIPYAIEDAVICSRYLAQENFNTIHGELKDATLLKDFDVFIIGVVPADMELGTIPNINRANTLVCEVDEYNSAKNYIVMK